MNTGWITIHRKITEWEWYQNSEMVHLFLHLILMANRKDGRWQGKEIKRGQIIVGRHKLSEQTGISEQTIRTLLSKLEASGEITKKSTNENSLITIVKYDYFQKREKNQPATNQQLTTNNNITSKQYNLLSPDGEKENLKPMNTYNENEHADSKEMVIDAETGSPRIAPQKRNKVKGALNVVDFFGKQCQLHHLPKPIKDSASYFTALNATKQITPSQLKELLNDWFASGEERQNLVQITRALSNKQINAFKARHNYE